MKICTKVFRNLPVGNQRFVFDNFVKDKKINVISIEFISDYNSILFDMYINYEQEDLH